MKKGIFTLLGLSILVMLLACATQKSRYDQSGVGKIYHDVTAKYNGYFNANEIIEESILTLNDQHQDNYTDILEIYPYRAAPNPEAVASNLDEAIKKVSVVATLHEASQWVDDCYVIIGKAFYLKQDFESAQNALEFFLDDFNPDGTRITKKKKRVNPNARKTRTKSSVQSAKKRTARAKQQERARKKYNKQLRKEKKKSQRKSSKGKKGETPTAPKTARNAPPPTSLEAEQRKPEAEVKKNEGAEENPGGLKHKPAYQEGQLWLARTYVDRENYPGVERLLNGLKGNPNLQDDVRDEIPLVWSYYMLKRENYAGAIPYLKEAIEVAKKKSEKARLSYILGQIAERDGEFALAAEYYDIALKNNSDYTLAFNARLSLARTALASGTRTSDDVTSELEKMLKDDKNAEYIDQIYFTLGRIALEQNDIPGAIAYFMLAAENGTANPTQLTETNYLLATLYFDRGDYVNAKYAYDATLSTMDKKDERYREVERLSKNLSDIAMHLQTITLQDSLLRLSNLSDAERLELAKKMYKDPAAQGNGTLTPVNTKGGAGAKVMATSGPGGPPSRPTPGVGSLPSTFFAYDQKEVKRGLRDFENDWGSRALVDNWRISSISARDVSYDDTTAVKNQPAKAISDDDVNNMFRDVPKTDEKRTEAREAIQNAMLQLGSLYRDKLEMYPLSIETLEELLQKYPDTKYALDAYYQLYLSYTAVGNISKADYYKNKIIQEYASSKYAMVLTDPDYMKKQLTEEQKLDRDYQETYRLINEGQYDIARERIISAKETYGTNHKLQAKYSILEAMCIGNLEGKEAYIDALKGVIGSYPGTPEEIKARDMLLLLDSYQGSRLNLPGSDGPKFEVAMDAQHFVLVQVSGNIESDAQNVKVSISNYNRKYHSLDKLKISSLRFDTNGDQVIILVRSFKDGEAAKKYLENVAKYSTEFVPDGTNYEVFAVTQHNYREIVAQKSVETYRTFYDENYK